MSPLLTGFPFSAGGAAKATVTSTTGSPTVDTTSRPGKTIYKYTGSGTITIGVAGSCEYLVIGGGAVNGAGGYIYNTSADLPAGTLTVTIGAGVGFASSTVGGSGNATRLGDVVALAGGFVDFNFSGGTMAFTGGSSGGSRITSTTRSAALSGAQGKDGGQGFTNAMSAPTTGGGGGASAAGGNSSSSVGGNGGAGSANSITGSSVTYAAGAGGWGPTTVGTPTGNGTANTGNGGSQTGDGSSTNTGGSGFVVVVIG
jgi:hypothetical protein